MQSVLEGASDLTIGSYGLGSMHRCRRKSAGERPRLAQTRRRGLARRQRRRVVHARLRATDRTAIGLRSGAPAGRRLSFYGRLGRNRQRSGDGAAASRRADHGLPHRTRLVPQRRYRQDAVRQWNLRQRRHDGADESGRKRVRRASRKDAGVRSPHDRDEARGMPRGRRRQSCSATGACRSSELYAAAKREGEQSARCLRKAYGSPRTAAFMAYGVRLALFIASPARFAFFSASKPSTRVS